MKLTLTKRTLARPDAPPSRSRRQGVRTGSIYLTLAVGFSGVLTYLFQGMSAQFLGLARYGALATLWSTTFLLAQVLWIGAAQTLGRYVAEREARGEDWRPVVTSVRRLEWWLLGLFLLVALPLSPLLTKRLFGGDVVLTIAFLATIPGFSFNYFRRGLLSGHHQFARLSGLIVVESVSRVLLAAVLLVAGAGVIGPAVGITLAPLLSVLFVRVAPVAPLEKEGEPFSIGGALRFTMPVLVSMACAQALANGGPILVSGLGGPGAHEQAGLLLAALIITRMPQYVLSPVISNLLPHLSRIAALQDLRRFNNLVARAVGAIGLVGAGLVAGTWLFGQLAMRLFGSEFVMSRDLLTVLALMAAIYLLCELLNQVLFARGLARLAALSWLVGLAVTGGITVVLRMELLHRVSYSLALGTASTAITLAACHIVTLNRYRARTETLRGDT